MPGPVVASVLVTLVTGVGEKLSVHVLLVFLTEEDKLVKVGHVASHLGLGLVEDNGVTVGRVGRLGRSWG